MNHKKEPITPFFAVENELRKILTLFKHAYAALPVACVAKKCYLRFVFAWHYVWCFFQ